MPGRSRAGFTGFGTLVFWLGLILLGGQLIAGTRWTQGLIYKLTQGFQSINTFAFAHNYLYELGKPQIGGNAATFLTLIPQAIADSVNGSAWSVVALVMVCVLGTWALWNPIKENYFWIIGVPFVGGLLAWVLSNWVIHSLLWVLLLASQALAALGLASAPLETRLEAMHLVIEAAGESLKQREH